MGPYRQASPHRGTAPDARSARRGAAVILPQTAIRWGEETKWFPFNRRQNREALRGRNPSFTPRIESLEDRSVPSTFTVTNLGDGGPDSLRQAVLDANFNPGADAIRFATAARGTIALSSELSVTDDLAINGPGVNRLTVSGAGWRAFAVSGSSTDVTIRHLTVAGGKATGGTAAGI